MLPKTEKNILMISFTHETNILRKYKENKEERRRGKKGTKRN